MGIFVIMLLNLIKIYAKYMPSTFSFFICLSILLFLIILTQA